MIPRLKIFFECYTLLENVSDTIFEKNEFYSDNEENNSDLDMDIDSD